MCGTSCLTEQDVQLDAMKWLKRDCMSHGITPGELGGKKDLQGTDPISKRLTRRERKGNQIASALHAVRLLLVVDDWHEVVI